MKILFISMPSIHVTRWIENLENSGHELYWFDVLSRGELETAVSVQQITNWGKRKLPYFKGEYFLRKKLPKVYQALQSFLEVTANEKLIQLIKEIQPDLVHSFEMQGCCYPILETMFKFSNLKWLYSCWGSDLYYYKNIKEHNKKIKKILNRVDFLHTDCHRDFLLAQELGFKGKHLGIIPGGTGYKLKELEHFKLPVSERKIILVKGYEHHFGRGLNIVKALYLLQTEIQNYEVVVFGSHPAVIEFIKENRLNFRFFNRHGLTHDQLIGLMGQSLLYIGNSISDGMPNTLLEAVVMGAFPIQSNPGGVTEEIITNGENGYLIYDPESVMGIKKKIMKAILNLKLMEQAVVLNEMIAFEKLDYSRNKQKVIDFYKMISKCE